LRIDSLKVMILNLPSWKIGTISYVE